MGLSARLLFPAALGAALSLTALAVPAYAAEAPGMTSDRVFGYNIGALERDELITKVSGTWTVPSATSHTLGEPARSLAWIGLGQGCVTYDCRIQDGTAIQIGTEIRVDWLGIPTYHTWYRTASHQDATDMELPITYGDRVRASLERAPNNPLLWKLSFRNLTSGVSWSRTLPAASALASAQFVVESTGYPELPAQDATRFDDISVNGTWAQLRPEERVTFVPAMTEDVVGTASLPDAEGNGFAACAWATNCTL